jgi:hypothetical protein
MNGGYTGGQLVAEPIADVRAAGRGEPGDLGATVHILVGNADE